MLSVIVIVVNNELCELKVYEMVLCYQQKLVEIMVFQLQMYCFVIGCFDEKVKDLKMLENYVVVMDLDEIVFDNILLLVCDMEQCYDYI